MLNSISKQCLRYALYGLMFTYGLVPIIVKLFPQIMHYMIFLHIVRVPFMKNLSDIGSFDIPLSQNYYLQTDTGVRCGLWHILPVSLQNQHGVTDKKFVEYLSLPNLVVLYLHGNSGTRGADHRVKLYKVLSDLDFHVIALDYRGYGDSTGFPSEPGVVADSLAVYEWIMAHKSSSTPVIVWGHSLGTAIATSLVAHLSKAGIAPHALILEAPFTNMAEMVEHHPMSLPFSIMPYFHNVFVEPLSRELHIHFHTDRNIFDTTCPILILHAQDDGVVPFHLGQTLYEKSKAVHRHSIQLIEFDSKHGYGHKHIHQAPQLPQIISDFIKSIIISKVQ